jgi:hypothetical protein
MSSRCDRKIKPVALRQNQTAADNWSRLGVWPGFMGSENSPRARTGLETPGDHPVTGHQKAKAKQRILLSNQRRN